MSNATQGSAPPPTDLPTPSPPEAASPPLTTTTTPPTNNASVTPPLATPSTPPPTTPAIPSTTPPATPSAPPPAVPSSPPPSIPETPPATPSSPSPPNTVTPSPPAPSSGGSGGGGTPPSTQTDPAKANPPPSTKTEPAKTNPPPPPSSSSSSSDSDSGGGVSTSLVIGVVVGGAVLLLLLTLFCACRRRKTRRSSSNDPFHGGPPLPLPVKDTMNGGRQSQTMYQQNAPPPSDESIRIPAPPARASRPPLPPPLPIAFSSSGASGSNYSDGPIVGAPSPGMSLGFSKSTFTFEELSRATDGFSDANLLGQGGFGYVHRGMLPNGKEVAVKQLKVGSGQGDREFHAEIEIISRVHHRHLVSLVGYCITGEQRLLVYEFVPNYTLEFHLHGKNRPTMDFATRLKIALGSAKGLAYLHEDCHPKIIHRDIKAANILLDYKFEAKVADFGLAKFSADNDTHVSTRVMGTFGYLAPEYAASGKLTEKSDVFSFGVMLLELITGRRPVDKHNNFADDSLVDWARPLLTRAMEDRIFDDIVDPQLQGNYKSNEMARMVACATSCVRHSARRRPRMSQIVRALEGDVSLDDLNDGVVPGHSTLYGSSMGSSDYDTGMYKEDMKRFRKVALASQEYSRGYSQATSEYGLNPSSSEIQTGEIRRSG